jgi:hypothetical protein
MDGPLWYKPGISVFFHTGAPLTLTEMQFNSPTQDGGRGNPPPAATYPRGYEVQVSTNARRGARLL